MKKTQRMDESKLLKRQRRKNWILFICRPLLECFHSSSDSVCLQVRLSRRNGEYTICACTRKRKRENKGRLTMVLKWGRLYSMSTQVTSSLCSQIHVCIPIDKPKNKNKKSMWGNYWSIHLTKFRKKIQRGYERGGAANYENCHKQLPSAENHTFSLSHAHTPTHTVNPVQQSDPPSTHWTPADPTFPHLSSILPER